MATIKPIEARSVHQIQSGQVIVDLYVRFKNNGLDLIEVQDNGHGISPNNYESLALKHYTSKLSTFADLTSLQTFGFRGEALSSLCAVSNLTVVTAEAQQAPRASKLDFEFSGRLKSTQVVAGQRGTTVSIENLFKPLPVRRRELEKNVKREYGKVIALLHAYACISTGVRFNVKNQMPKGKSVVVFTTKSNPTTRENISNVYGAKTLLALMPLDLNLEFEPSSAAKRFSSNVSNKLFVHGHISKPIFGEGRQTPDRQMFFVNSRPCGLPQIAKAFNEVYKSFNLSQSPFIFANFEMDTSAYDVNVSPDKRTILLHDAGALIESLKASLTELFENQDQTVPVSQLAFSRQSQLTPKTGKTPLASTNATQDELEEPSANAAYSQELGENDTVQDNDLEPTTKPQSSIKGAFRRFESGDQGTQPPDMGIIVEDDPVIPESSGAYNIPSSTNVEEVEGSLTQLQPAQEQPISSSPSLGTPTHKPGVVQNAFDRMRMNRTPVDVATITIGNKTYQSTIGRDPVKGRLDSYPGLHLHSPSSRTRAITIKKSKIGRSIQSFTAPGTQLNQGELDDDLIEDEENEEEDNEACSSSQSNECDGHEEELEELESGEDSGDEEQAEGEEQTGEEHEDHQVESLQQDQRIQPEDADASTSDSDESYVDDEERKSREDAKVSELIKAAEEASAIPSEQSIERAERLARKPRKKDCTHDLACTIDTSVGNIESQLKALQRKIKSSDIKRLDRSDDEDDDQQIAPETKLSLAVSKKDFSRMRIIGQFNLGFILATRPGGSPDSTRSSARPAGNEQDELFIIDQHASDEKYNFERLQAETTVQNQRLVKPKTLDLTSVEEEVIIDNLAALEKNGFIVEIDTSGDEPIGRRCKLISLPLSKEVVFDTRDLEELIVLLSEAPQQSQNNRGKRSRNELDSDAEDVEPSGIASSPFSDYLVPRPSKVRKMFAMRACRSSIMIGKNLTHRQMETVVKHMGTIDKPWNCPHGRPTMRHLVSLGQWNEWSEWESYKQRQSRAGGKEKSIKYVWEEFVEDYGS
ncbi:DNA mismatch repair protein pms1 [Nannizzia gypsea CBS 118893]|uniref:DNA mismatch repair protein pms1 n=1 Tax=Arthroderma gypseum (strain ATCC MYA-4604 / CBS 118893) TaxID=535722 RepID=E4UR46_ARTGP|nr:DNA mismatch repair protein pms1 [Nannizzia gypsea CBS 118893]EFQ99321.1 DNA mismatch repair protein pms1 [Nannizzia gypsea CBS 118893]